MAISVNDILRVAVRWKDYYGDDNVNVWFFRVDTLPALPDDATICQEICDDMASKMYSSGLSVRLDDNANFQDVKVDRVDFFQGKIRTLEALGTYVPTAPLPGGNSSDPLPPAVSAVGLLKTVGVKTLGRKYIGMICENDNSAGTFTSALVTPLLTYLGYFLASITLPGGTEMQAVIHGKRAAAWLQFVSAAVSTYAGVQRRRRQRVGS